MKSEGIFKQMRNTKVEKYEDLALVRFFTINIKIVKKLKYYENRSKKNLYCIR